MYRKRYNSTRAEAPITETLKVSCMDAAAAIAAIIMMASMTTMGATPVLTSSLMLDIVSPLLSLLIIMNEFI